LSGDRVYIFEGVAGAHRHFDPVERPPTGYFAVLYEVPRDTVHAHIDGRQIVGCPDDQVRPGNEPAFIEERLSRMLYRRWAAFAGTISALAGDYFAFKS